MNVFPRVVVNGLEGCQKSSNLFKELSLVATPEKPVVFAFKNYALMKEQMVTWSSRFRVPLSDFAICGFNKSYEPAQDAYTNKENPHIVPMTARFIFVSQGLLQRNRVKDLIFEYKIKKGIRPSIQHIVIDEFDFSMGIVPTLDYFVNHCPDKELKEKLSKNICDFIKKNYTAEDVYRFQQSKEDTDAFNLAYWLDDADCPVTILTSEILATIFLEIIGFEVKDVGVKSFKDKCIINVDNNKEIGRNFFSKMNQELAWNKLGFDVIVSDCIATGVKDTDTLSVDVVCHTSARGSNNFMGKNILTVISYIPQSKIIEIKDCINCFITLKNRDDSKLPYFSYDEVEALFYRDRMCQAVGRVIGYRSGSSTHLLVHENIYQALDGLSAIEYYFNQMKLGNVGLDEYMAFKKECKVKFNALIEARLLKGISLIPYEFKSWSLSFEGKNELYSRIKEANDRSKKGGFEKKRNKVINKKAVCSTNLDIIFEKDTSNTMTATDIKKIIIGKDLKSIGGTGYLQPAKVAKHFGCVIQYARVDGKPQQIVVGLKPKEQA